MARSRQEGPLTIQQPFYPEGPLCHLYLLHPPAGVVGGDRLQLHVETREAAQALVTTPGATKFYRTNGRTAEQYQRFIVGHAGSFEWLPQETIYYPDADALLRTTVELEGTARFLGWEVHCLGLPVNDLDFGGGRARVGFTLYRDGEPVLVESLLVSEEKKRFQAAFMQNKPVFGSFVATNADESLLEELRTLVPDCDGALWGATLLGDILVVRYLGASVWQARELFLAAWRFVRPRVLGLEPCLPRIWAT